MTVNENGRHSGGVEVKKARKRWIGTVTCLACVVVFCTVYALILPAITLNADEALDCGFTVHQHSEECYDADGRLVCGLADFAVHTHDPELCYDSEGNLVCSLPEICAHEHGEDCYEESLHLICGLEEDETHLHGPDCYETERVLVCSETVMLPHIHSDECYEDVTDEEGNVTGRTLTCGLLQIEEHRHDVSCLRAVGTTDDAVISLSAEPTPPPPDGADEVFNGFVNSMTVQSMQTGSAPFDIDDSPGNDSSPDNKIVRTFDTISYKVEAAFMQQNTNGALIPQNSELNFEISMYKKITEARFDISTMSWLDTGSAEWEIDYWSTDSDGKEYIVLVERKVEGETKLYGKDENGNFTREVSINAIVNGSDNTNNTAYQTSTGGIIRQTLTGRMKVCTAMAMSTGTQTFSTGVRVRNAVNGREFTPTFKAWFTENSENIGTDGTADTNNTATAETVKVSCAPLYNLTLLPTSEYVNYLSWYDFDAGNEVTDEALLAYLEAAGKLQENYDRVDPNTYTNNSNDAAVAAAYSALTEAQKASLSNIRYGRMNALGITLSLASESEPSANNKGYKGCSLPVDTVTFDLALGVETKITEGNPNTDGYSAILWDYRPNYITETVTNYEDGSAHTRQWKDLTEGTMGRNLFWRGIEASKQGIRVAPSGYRGNSFADNAVYDSGTWTLTAIDNSAAFASTVNNANSVYTFEVRDYDFDLNSYLYPSLLLGESVKSTKFGVTDFAFFGGYAQVLYVMPFNISGTVEIKQSITLGNLELTDFSGQKLNLPDGAVRGETVLADNEAGTSDNTAAGAVKLYSPGDFVKRNSFNTANATNHTMPDSFLGTYFWGNPNWDESAFAGSKISIMGSAQLPTESDNLLRAVNLLQLFDSTALSVTPKTEMTGSYITQDNVDFGNFYENTFDDHNPEVKYLFAADPDKPGGYNTNESGVVSYMNTVREQDLVYSDKLYWNEAEERYNIVKYTIDGVEKELTCVGVLSEVRNACFLAYCYVRVPVTVKDDEALVSKTVCTVNTAYAWTDVGAMTDVTWLNGVWNSDDGKNTLEGYVAITSANTAGGNGYYSYNGADSFTKVEYTGDGKYETGSSGKMEGASLLILGYKAKVNIDNRKHMDTTYSTYTPSEGENSVTWVVTGIATELDTAQNTSATALTNLTVPVSLKYSGSAALSQQSLFYVLENSSCITEYKWATDENSNIFPVCDEYGNQLTERKTVSTDSSNPTSITFKGTKVVDGVSVDCLYTYSVYAEESADKTGVTYHISGAPVGQVLPEISFTMNLGNSLQNNDSVTAVASISGSGDMRAYSEQAGNTRSNTVNIAKTGGSLLSKQVDVVYAEIGSAKEYTVTYTNDSNDPISRAYFYDNLPYDGDTRGSAYDMGDDGTSTDGTIVQSIDFRSLIYGAPSGDFQANVTVYYPRDVNTDDTGTTTFTKMSDRDFSRLMYGFQNTRYCENGSPVADKLDEMLKATDGSFGVLIQSEDKFVSDPNGQYYKLRAEPADETGYEQLVEFEYAWYTKTAPTETTGENYEKRSDGSYLKFVRRAVFVRSFAMDKGWITGQNEDGSPIYSEGGEAAYLDFLSTIPGVVVRIENMGPDRSLEMKITMGTSNNKAGDVYVNDAWEWTEGSAVLNSNNVRTTTVGRTISGRVWVDRNLNGVYDEGEAPLNGVTCTLFKWDSAQNKYVACTGDVAGRSIGTVTSGSYNYTYTRDGKDLTIEAYLNNGTFFRDEHGHIVKVTATQNEDGKFRFDALPAGRYLVAFSGDVLGAYGGATAYQVNLKNDESTNDGVSLSATPGSNLDKEIVLIDGFDNQDGTYKYAIAYTLADSTVGDIVLHPTSAYESGSVTLTDSVELCANQDLGLVEYAGMELPNTGGIGTELFAVLGLSLILLSALLLPRRRKD